MYWCALSQAKQVWGRQLLEYLFVYGTLRSDFLTPELRVLLAPFKSIGAATAPGWLYDFGEYPGALLAESDNEFGQSEANGLIQGELLVGKVTAQGWLRLDEYEGYDLADPVNSLFVRKRCFVRSARGENVTCWIYAYNGAITAAHLIVSGDFADVRK